MEIANLQARLAVLEDLILKLPMSAWGEVGAQVAAFPALRNMSNRKRQRQNECADENDVRLERLTDRSGEEEPRTKRARQASAGRTAEELGRRLEPLVRSYPSDWASSAGSLTPPLENDRDAKVVTEVSFQSILSKKHVIHCFLLTARAIETSRTC